jgi:hypothetical protein
VLEDCPYDVPINDIIGRLYVKEGEDRRSDTVMFEGRKI